MGLKLDLNKKIGIIFSSLLIILVILNFIHIDRNSSVTYITMAMSFILNFIFLILCITSIFIKKKKSALLQVFCLFLIGTLTMMDSENAKNVCGEMIMMVFTFFAWRFHLIEKNKKLKILFIFIYVIGFKLIFLIIRGVNIFDEGYIVVATATTIPFILIFSLLIFEEENIFTAFKKLCIRYSSELPFIKIGHNFYENFAHDYKINDIIMLITLVQRKLEKNDNGKATELLEMMLEMANMESAKMNDIKNEIRAANKTEKKKININEHLKSNWQILAGFMRSKEEDVKLRLCEDDLFCWIPISELNIILRNIINNSYEATDEEDRKIIIETKRSIKSGNILIEDNGTGIEFAPKGDVPLNLFIPGKTTKEKGTGFGMSAVLKKIEVNGWKIKIINKKENGCITKITFPLKNADKKEEDYEKIESLVL